MPNINLAWTLPTLRQSNKPYNVLPSTRIEIEISADEGATFVAWNTFAADVTSAVVTDLEPGLWKFRARCIDEFGNGPWLPAEYRIADTTAPGPLASFTATGA